MDETLRIASEALAIAGTVGAVCRWVLVAYLKDQFASKSDVEKIHVQLDGLNAKVSTLVESQFARRRRSKHIDE